MTLALSEPRATNCAKRASEYFHSGVADGEQDLARIIYTCLFFTRRERACEAVVFKKAFADSHVKPGRVRPSMARVVVGAVLLTSHAFAFTHVGDPFITSQCTSERLWPVLRSCA